MKDEDKFKEYQISESDIDKIISYLKIVDPENATPENAISFLGHYATRFHEMGHALSDDQLQEFYNQFKNDKLDT